MDDRGRSSNCGRSNNALKYTIINYDRTISYNKAVSTDQNRNQVKPIYKPNIVQLDCQPRWHKKP